jgi:hypothetical protein
MRTKFSISVFSAQKNASSVLDLIIPKIVEFAILDSTRRALMDIGETGKITFANVINSYFLTHVYSMQ